METLAIDHEDSALETGQLALADNATQPAPQRSNILTEMLRQQQALTPPRIDQSALTATEAFSSFHDGHDQRFLLPQSRYRELMPASPPQPGQQYAFEVEI